MTQRETLPQPWWGMQKSSEILIGDDPDFCLWLFLVRALFADPCLGRSRSETFDVCCIYIYRQTFTEVCRKDHSFLQMSPKQSIEYHVCCLNPHEIPLAIPVVDGYNPINPYCWWLQILWNPCLAPITSAKLNSNRVLSQVLLVLALLPCARFLSWRCRFRETIYVKYEDFTDFTKWYMMIYPLVN